MEGRERDGLGLEIRFLHLVFGEANGGIYFVDVALY